MASHKSATTEKSAANKHDVVKVKQTNQEAKLEAKKNERSKAAKVPHDVLARGNVDLRKLLMTDLQSENEDDAKEAMRSVIEYIGFDRKKLKEAVDMSFLGMVFLCMKRFPSNESIQSNGCRCMAMTMFGCPRNIKPSFQRTVMSLGGIETIMSLLNSFPESENIHRECFHALFGLVSDGNDAACEQIFQLDGISLALTAIKNFEESRDYALRVLNGLAKCKTIDCMQCMLKSGVLGVAVAAFENRMKEDDEYELDFGSEFDGYSMAGDELTLLLTLLARGSNGTLVIKERYAPWLS